MASCGESNIHLQIIPQQINTTNKLLSFNFLDAFYMTRCIIDEQVGKCKYFHLQCITQSGTLRFTY